METFHVNEFVYLIVIALPVEIKYRTHLSTFLNKTIVFKNLEPAVWSGCLGPYSPAGKARDSLEKTNLGL